MSAQCGLEGVADPAVAQPALGIWGKLEVLSSMHDVCVCVCVCGWGVEERGGNRDESLLVQEVEVVLFGCLEGLKCPAEELVVLLVHSEMEQHPGLHPLSWATFVSLYWLGSTHHLHCH